MKIFYPFSQEHAVFDHTSKISYRASLLFALFEPFKLVMHQISKICFTSLRIKPFLIVLLGASILSSSCFAEDITVNRLLASQCAQCHGPSGNAVGGMEKLTDESAKDLYEDLRDMQQEDRPEDIMDHQALGYTEDQIRRIADYYGFLSGKNEDKDDDDDDDDDDEDEDDEDENH